MITIYHNPRCRKSREGLHILEAANTDFKIIKYMQNPISGQDLKDIIAKLGITPMELIRKNETLWISNFKDCDLSDEQLIEVMINHPKLMERPIVVNKNLAVIGRPPETIKSIL